MKQFALLTLLGLFAVGCSTEFQPEDLDDRTGVSNAFSVSEAKSMFEYSASGMEVVQDAFLCSGDFTPLWDDARYTEVSGREYYDVPILPTYKYKVLNSSFVRGRSVVSRDEVYQKLVVMKTSLSASGVYVVSLIPASDNGARLSGLCPVQVEDSGFSGTIVYSDLASGSLVRVNVYEAGHKVYGVYVPVVRSYEDLRTALNERLCALSLYRYSSVLTKYDSGEIDPAYCYDEEEIDPAYCYPEPNPDPYESPYGEENPPEDPEDEALVDDEYNEDAFQESMAEIDAQIELGRQGVEKMTADLESGNVKIYQHLNGALSGVGVGVNANGIIMSAANFLKGLENSAFLNFGKALGYTGIGITTAQTIIVLQTEGLSANDIANIVSATLGACALMTASFPVASGILGIASGIVGIVSNFLSETLDEGLYVVEINEGKYLYIYVGGGVS